MYAAKKARKTVVRKTCRNSDVLFASVFAFIAMFLISIPVFAVVVPAVSVVAFAVIVAVPIGVASMLPTAGIQAVAVVVMGVKGWNVIAVGVRSARPQTRSPVITAVVGLPISSLPQVAGSGIDRTDLIAQRRRRRTDGHADVDLGVNGRRVGKCSESAGAEYGNRAETKASWKTHRGLLNLNRWRGSQN
jgi:hypothetical protein